MGASDGRYGVFWYRGKNISAHRMAWTFIHGKPEGLIRHSCDNPPCVNIRHLLEGTQKDNMADRIEHGKGYPHGEAHSQSILTASIIQAAADLRRQRWSWTRIANAFGVSRSTISRAVQHQNASWGHVDTGDVPRTLITDDLIARATALRDKGVPWKEVTRRLGISRPAYTYATTKRKRR
jgi:hypothetical protein